MKREEIREEERGMAKERDRRTGARGKSKDERDGEDEET